ncbi:MAG: protein kinase, partial [Planctomycetota bacterium]
MAPDLVTKLRDYVSEVIECEQRFSRLGLHPGTPVARLKEPELWYCEISDGGGAPTVSHPAVGGSISELIIGDVVADRYVLRDKLGEGGNGIVFLAFDQILGRNVALKVERRNEVAALKEALAREAKMAAQLSHRNIAAVYDFGAHDEQPYTTFEYVEGKTLRHAMIERGSWQLSDIQLLMTDLAEALDFAHSEGVVHRDLKPENICLTIDGTPKILDFGIARNLHVDPNEKVFRGTVAYAAPEQAACRPVDGRTDQYALALIVYELLTGTRPFQSESVVEVLRMQKFDHPPRLHELLPDLPEPVADAVMKALSKDPAQRYATCRAFAQAFCSEAAKIKVNDSRKVVHVSLTAGESLIARRMARELAKAGYPTWYYQQDAIPGLPLPRQVEGSLQSTEATVLLISRESLRSTAFADEVMTAHRLGRPCLPVLVGITLEEFASHQPIWRPALGAAAIIELSQVNPNETFERIIEA